MFRSFSYLFARAHLGKSGIPVKVYGRLHDYG